MKPEAEQLWRLREDYVYPRRLNLRSVLELIINFFRTFAKEREAHNGHNSYYTNTIIPY
jgi:hypothetical protein